MSKFINKKKHKLLSLTAIRLLRKVQKQLRLHPETYNQQNPTVHKCGTPACICGWMEHLAGEDFARVGRIENIGLTRMQWSQLFFATQWPVEFYVRNSGISKIKASTAIHRIEHFIQTDGQE